MCSKGDDAEGHRTGVPARSTVRARLGGVPAQLDGDEGVGARARVVRENLLGGQRGEELASAIGGARAALPGEAVQEDRGQGRVDAQGATELGPTELGPSELGPTDLGPVLSFKG